MGVTEQVKMIKNGKLIIDFNYYENITILENY